MSSGTICDRQRLCDVLDENQRLGQRVSELERQNLLQGEEIRLMKLRSHGQSSERITAEDARQGLLFDEAELYSRSESEPLPVEEVRITKTVYTRRKRGRKPISPKLSRIELVVDLSEAEKTVGEGFELVRIGEETSEQVHEVPQKYIVIRTVRPKYVVRPIVARGFCGGITDRDQGRTASATYSSAEYCNAVASSCGPDWKVLRRPAVLPPGAHLRTTRTRNQPARYGELGYRSVEEARRPNRAYALRAPG